MKNLLLSIKASKKGKGMKLSQIEAIDTAVQNILKDMSKSDNQGVKQKQLHMQQIKKKTEALLDNFNEGKS